MPQTKKTLVVGASLKPDRASNKAAIMLQERRIPSYLFGLREGKIGRSSISKMWPENDEFHTITLYLNPKRQEEYIDKILALKPVRVLFNPGTENAVFQEKLSTHQIAFEEACTLVLLHSNQY